MTRILMVAAAMSLMASMSFAQGASAPAAARNAGHWDKEHRRRAEVNHRLNKQNLRIHEEVNEGDLSTQKAAQLHKDDHQIL